MLFARKHHLVLPYLFRVSCNFQEIHATLKIFTSGLQIWFKGSFLVLYHFFQVILPFYQLSEEKWTVRMVYFLNT